MAFLSEYQSDREFELLNAHRDEVQVKVVRGGRFQTVAQADVVVGDLVLLETGDEIAADGRVIRATALTVDQSLMTGESEPTAKGPSSANGSEAGPENPACLYRGTHVVEGAATMLVTAVGDATYLGEMARRLSDPDADAGQPASDQTRIRQKLTLTKHLTPLQQKLEALAGVISNVGYFAAGAIFLALVTRGVLTHEIGWAEPGPLASATKLLGYFMYMVIVIVVAVPEGLPMSVTVSLALAMKKMTRANSLVRQLVACETIGSATVICCDKTGTLTKNQMQVAAVAWDGCTLAREGADGVPARVNAQWPRDPLPVDAIVMSAAVNATAHLEERDGALRPVGNSTEAALLLWLREQSIDYRQLRLQFPALYRIHFSSDRKRMTTVIRAGDRVVALVKGAPEWLLEHSTHYQDRQGSWHPWSEEMRLRVKDQLRHASLHAMRSLAFGYRLLPTDHPDEEAGIHEVRETLEQEIVFSGLVSIRDPIREDVKDALASCRRAGIDVKMITGDNVETARAIAAEIGLLPEASDDGVLTSSEFNDRTDEQLKKELPGLRVLARARPLDKYRMVRLLQELGEVVAVTGDGTNDALALKKADVGLSMGIAGTEVAKEASRIVLLDDAFSTIVKAVHWGRALYENIQRFLQFQLTINVSALLIAFLGPALFGIRPPFTILQLLWINVIMDTLASIALCSEPPRKGLMNVPPKRREESILSRAMLGTILLTAGFFVVVMMALLLLMRGASDTPDGFTVRQVTLFFTIYVLFQVWNEINCRSLVPEVSGFQGLLRNKVLLGVAALIVAGQLLIVTLGGRVFAVEPLGVVDWTLILIGTSSVVLFGEITRKVRPLFGR